MSRADGSKVRHEYAFRQAKKQQKQKPQKTLKQRRREKRAAKQFGSGPLLPTGK